MKTTTAQKITIVTGKNAAEHIHIEYTTGSPLFFLGAGYLPVEKAEEFCEELKRVLLAMRDTQTTK